MINQIFSKFLAKLRKKLRSSDLGFVDKLYYLFRIFFAKILGLYPFPISNEIRSVNSVLISGNWNTTYSLSTKVNETEENFQKFLDVKNCILVSSGGVGIEMIMRVMKSNSINSICHHIRHICPATPFSILRSGVAPIPTNPLDNPFGLPSSIYENTSKEKLVLSTHLWGYPEDILNHPKEYLIEDCCLSFESYHQDGRHVGTVGKAGVFSFGCLKPIQAGEGGLICTNDDSLAKELRIIQNYANEIKITGSEDINRFGLNGRMSCITSAIVCEQLKNYSLYVKRVRNGVKKLKEFIYKNNLPVKIFIPKGQQIDNLGFSSILLEVEPIICESLIQKLAQNGIETISPFFNDILKLTYFKKNLQNELNEEQKKVYFANYNKNINESYAYPENYIAVSRRWISSFVMRKVLENALLDSL